MEHELLQGDKLRQPKNTGHMISLRNHRLFNA